MNLRIHWYLFGNAEFVSKKIEVFTNFAAKQKNSDEQIKENRNPLKRETNRGRCLFLQWNVKWIVVYFVIAISCFKASTSELLIEVRLNSLPKNLFLNKSKIYVSKFCREPFE